MVPRTVYEGLEDGPPPSAAVGAFVGCGGAAILESAFGTATYGRYTILADDPVAEARVEACDAEDVLARLKSLTVELSGAAWEPGGRMETHGRTRAGDSEGSSGELDSLPPACGWMGYLAYEAGLGAGHASAVRRRHVPSPAAHFRFHDHMAVFDRRKGEWLLAAVDWPSRTPAAGTRPSAKARIDSLRRRLGRVEAGEDGPRVISPPAFVEWNMSRGEYFERVARIKEHLAAGDVYQVNLSQRFTARTKVSPREVYLGLRGISPPSHGAFLDFGEYSVLSSSPELFLALDGEMVVTRPIKGTRRRTGVEAIDQRMREELRESEKEQAELVMIVDLMRNDLGRVCRFGSIAVHEAAAIEEHPTVFHQVATIGGRLRGGLDWGDLLKATFPPGSVTGAPKIRAMQIIDALEPTPRGVYCGSIGHVGLDGRLTLNVAIRTLVHRAGQFQGYAGGAIVADSVAEEEYEEIMTKSRAMVAALGCERAAPHVESTLPVSLA